MEDRLLHISLPPNPFPLLFPYFTFFLIISLLPDEDMRAISSEYSFVHLFIKLQLEYSNFHSTLPLAEYVFACLEMPW